MKIIRLALVGMIFISSIVQAQSCMRNGVMTNCSNGVSGTTINGPYGSTTQFSNGVSASTINGPNGNSVTTFSNGVTANSIRGANGITTTNMSDGRNCMSYPNGQTICN